MRSFLIKILLFSLSFIFLSLGLILATELDGLADFLPSRISLKKGTTSHQWTRQQEADKTENIDVLILGSSLGQSIDVRHFQKLNLSAFNFSSGSQTPIQSDYFLDKYFDSFQPKVVIWDLNPYTFSTKGLESTIDLIANCSDCSGMFSLLINTGSSLAWASYLKRMMLKPFEEEDLKLPLKTDISQYISHGYMESFLDAPESPMETDETIYPLLPIQQKIFEAQLKKLKAHSIAVILIYSPKSKSFIQNFKNQNNWFEYYDSLVDRGLATRFVNFNEIFWEDSLNRTNFFDLAHLTRKGIKQYNQALMDSLAPTLISLRN